MKRYGNGMRRIIAPLIGFLAVIGLADSAFLVLRHMGFISSEPPLIASACMISNGSCDLAAQSTAGSILGIPAPVLGGLYFAAVVVLVIVRLHIGRWLFPYATLGLMAAGLAYSGYLVYMLIAVLGQPCPYCLAAHGINISVFALFAISLHCDLSALHSAP